MKTQIIALIITVATMAGAETAQEQLRLFRSETDLVRRQAYIPKLMRFGGDEIVLEFRRSLFDTNLAGRKLASNEEGYMLSLVNAVGYLAITSNLARDFLTNAVHSSFWKTNVLWTTSLGDRQFSVLAARALAGLAVSGRSEFQMLAAEVKANPRMDDSRFSLAGGLFDAMFQRSMIETKGMESFLSMTAEERIQASDAWVRTEVGSNWLHWYVSIEEPSAIRR